MSKTTWEAESISSKFQLVVGYVLYSAFIIGNTFCLFFAVEKNSFLVKCKTLPAPKSLGYFLLNLLLMLIAAFLYQAIRFNLFLSSNGNLAFLLDVANITIYLMTTIASVIVVGVATQHFCIKVEQAEITAIPATSQMIFDPLVLDFQNLKDGLGPELFLIFFIKTNFIINSAYQMLVGNGFSYLFTGIIELLAMEYLISVVDDTYKAFKNTSNTLK